MLKQDLSTSFEVNLSANKEDKYLQCIKELKNQNKYKKQALQTAQSLIHTYRSENQSLKRQNHKLMLELSRKVKEVQELKQNLSMKQTSECKTFQVNARIQHMAERQQHYEDKIKQLQSKIMFMERQNKDTQKSKTKVMINTQMSGGQNTSFFYNPREKMKNVHKNLTELRNMHLKMKKNQDQTYHFHHMNNTADQNHHDKMRATFSESERVKTPQYSTPKMKSKGYKNQWK